MTNSLYLLFSNFVFFFFITTSLSDDSHNAFFQCFSENLDSISSLTYTQSNSSYYQLWISTMQSARLPYSHTLKPIAIITPLEESQIPVIVTCSKMYGIEIRTRSGGHDYEGLSYISESTYIILDMRNIRSITIDAGKKTAWVQSGVTLGELYYAIGNTSRTLAFPAGVCPTVCVGGHISGGGFGMISRKFGLAIDHVLDVRIVDVNGHVLDRESMGEDYFWAIRGGGGASFGVILAFKLDLVSIPETLTGFTITRTSEQNSIDLVHKCLHIADKVDNNLGLRIFVRYLNDNVNGKKIRVVFKGIYFGGADKLLQLIQENFPNLGLVKEDCTEMSWIDSALYNYDIPSEATREVLLNREKAYAPRIKAKSDFLTEPIPKAGFTGLWKRIHEMGATDQFELQISPFGGRMNEISESELPFPHRLGTCYMIQYAVGWEQEEGVEEKDSIDAQRNINWLLELHSYLGSYVSKNPRSAYFNYRDLDLGTNNNNEENASYMRARDSWGVKYFKNNFERLVQVKTKVDPTNFFKNEQSIPVDVKGINEVTENKACNIKTEL